MKKIAEYLALLKYGEDISTEEYLAQDFANRVKAVANKAIFLEDRVKQLAQEQQQLIDALRQSQIEAEQGKAMAQQILQEAQVMLSEKDRLLHELAESSEEVRNALINIVRNMPTATEIISNTSTSTASAQNPAEIAQQEQMMAEMAAAGRSPRPISKSACLKARKTKRKPIKGK